MFTIRFCGHCNRRLPLMPACQKYCGRSCQNAAHYQRLLVRAAARADAVAAGGVVVECKGAK